MDKVYILVSNYEDTSIIPKIYGVFSTLRKAYAEMVNSTTEMDFEEYRIIVFSLDECASMILTKDDCETLMEEDAVAATQAEDSPFIPVQIEYEQQATVFVPQDFFILLAKEKLEEATDMLETVSGMPVWETGKDEVFPSINRVSHNGDILMEF